MFYATGCDHQNYTIHSGFMQSVQARLFKPAQLRPENEQRLETSM